MTACRSSFTSVQIAVVAAGLVFSIRPSIAGQPSSDWTGGYVGGFLGYDYASDDWRTGANAGTTAASPEGITAGLELGANYQVSLLVVGIEGDLSLLPLSDAADCGDQPADTCSINQTLLGSIRARAGIALDRTLIYGSGGFAFGHIDTSTSGPSANAVSNDVSGWTAGVGVEFLLPGSLSAGVEYRHTDYGSNAFLNGPAGGAAFDQTSDEVTLRLNWHP